ncbi:hypothetical protein F5B21DRAFT_529221 [Xylaria acuta]|nr:hypothetical protein F5B21DRAFT_529221 [Xylaria acuta]
MSELNFPQFSRLPFELRDAIWVRFALPRGPMLHSISYRHTVEDLRLCSFFLSGPGINLFMLPTTRALMQVNQEARKAVLAGRQLQGVDNSIYTIDVFLGGVYNIRDGYKRHLMLHKFFFVNWDIDMFYFRRGLHMHMGKFLDSSCLYKMKRIALEIKGPSAQVDGLYAPSYSQLFDGTSISALANLPSLDTIYLVLDFHAVRRIYAYTQFTMGSESDSDEQSETYSVELDDENDSEAEEELDGDSELHSYIEEYKEYGEIDFPDCSFESDDEDDYEDWLSELPEDQYGFHHVESGSHRYPETFTFRQQAPLTQIEISFQDWVDRMISSTKGDTMEFCGHPVDIQMVMDLYGGICRMVGSYYRGYIGFSAVDEPVPAYWLP